MAIFVTPNNWKGKNHTMVKFVDIPYVRPDMDAVLDSVKAAIQGLKTAKTYEAFRSAYMDYVQTDTELETSKHTYGGGWWQCDHRWRIARGTLRC